MPRNNMEQAQNTLALRKSSTGHHDGAVVALNECLDRLRRVVTDAGDFQFKLRHLPSRDALVLWAEFPERQTRWLRALCDAVKDYVGSLYRYRANLVWVKSEVDKNWGQFEAERERWTGIISEIFLRAGAKGGVQAEHAVQAAKAEHERTFASAKDAALSSTEVALAQKQAPLTKQGNIAPLEKLPDMKNDMTSYFDAARLTEKQREVASFAWEYGLTVTEIARRTGKHRTTVDELLAAAKKKIDEAGANERGARKRAETNPAS
jgi:hypothetical protein